MKRIFLFIALAFGITLTLQAQNNNNTNKNTNKNGEGNPEHGYYGDRHGDRGGYAYNGYGNRRGDGHYDDQGGYYGDRRGGDRYDDRRRRNRRRGDRYGHGDYGYGGGHGHGHGGYGHGGHGHGGYGHGGGHRGHGYLGYCRYTNHNFGWRPVGASVFNTCRQRVRSCGFENDRLREAMHFVEANYVNACQIADIMRLFSFESTRLRFAKYAFHRTCDIQNYHLVFDALTFNSSRHELDCYIRDYHW